MFTDKWGRKLRVSDDVQPSSRN